ncbi:MAG: DEAD/DEAH box helicase [bacterium]|nr:DEAD/DEAH box helicase [bacterium]
MTNENRIIEALRNLPPGDIYLLSPKPYVLRGFNYYRQGSVQRFEWNEEKSVLLARVKGSKSYTISIRVEDENLNYYCSCPAWNKRKNCKHVVCVVACIKNLINADHFKGNSIIAPHRRDLRRSLLLTKETRPEIEEAPPVMKRRLATGYSLVLKRDHSYFSAIATVYKGEKKASGRAALMPEELRPFATASPDYYYFRYINKISILEYLMEYGDTHPLFLKKDDEMIALKWDEGIHCRPIIKFNATTSDVSASICYFSDNDPKPWLKPYRLNNSIVINLESAEIGFMQEGDDLKLWQSVSKTFEAARVHELDQKAGGRDKDLPFTIPLETFRSLHFSVKGKKKNWLERFIFEADGNRSDFENGSYSCQMKIEMNEEESVATLCALRGINGRSAQTNSSFFKLLMIMESGRYNLSASMKAKKRRKVVIDAFMRLLSAGTKTEMERITKEALSNGDFGKRTVRAEAKSCLNDAFNSIKDELSSIDFDGKKWIITDNNCSLEAPLYTIPYKIFGTDIFNGMKRHSEMKVGAKALYASLPVLHEALKGEGIPLYFKGKLVVTSEWDFSFDAGSRAEGIDWFEIKPEISCDGKLLDEEAWQKALSHSGVVEGEETVEVLSRNTQKVLSAIGKVYGDNVSRKQAEREIVSVPRLQILDWVELRKLGVKIRLSAEDEALIKRLTGFEKIKEIPLPGKLNAKLRHYQKEGYYWLAFLYEHRFGACLADDMGLGKTLQSITLLAAIKEGKVLAPGSRAGNKKGGPQLIVMPPSLLFNWESEIKKFYPSLTVYSYAGADRKAVFHNYDVILTTYGVVRRDMETLEKTLFDVIIFDEAQAVKNIYASTTGAVRKLRGYFKLVVTGTPMENHLGEYFSSLDLALPGLLGEYEQFKKYLKADASANLDIIVQRTRPFVLRRTKEKILKELPVKTETDIYLELTGKQKVLYQKTVEMIKSDISAAYANRNAAQASIVALTAILKLRQLCISPRLIDPSAEEKSPKIEFLCSKLRELVDEGHSSLVFSQFTSFLDILEEELIREKIPYCRLDGSTPTAKRRKLVENFQNSETPLVFLLSLKAGGQGLTLTKASYVFHLDPWWNPAVENQASDRAHRIGQKNKVTITRLLMHHTIEEKMMVLKEKKMALFNAIMDDSKKPKKGSAISKEDFEFLLG